MQIQFGTFNLRADTRLGQLGPRLKMIGKLLPWLLAAMSGGWPRGAGAAITRRSPGSLHATDNSRPECSIEQLSAPVVPVGGAVDVGHDAIADEALAGQ